MEVSMLPLAPLYRTRLLIAGYKTLLDLESVDPEKLSADTNLSLVDCQNIFQIVENHSKHASRFRLATEFCRREEAAVPIMTFSQRLDLGLGGGVQTGMLTEVCGLPGTGKTQLCIQLACDVQIPSAFGGLEGEVIYIDIKGGFVVDRVIDIVRATVQHCQNIPNQGNIDIESIQAKMSVESLLNSIHVHTCIDYQQVLAVVNLLPDLLEQNPKIKLVLIDGISFHFRHDFEDLSLRTRILSNLAQDLIRLAREFSVAVVVTNQMTTKVHQGYNKGSHIVPCLGDSWGHAVTTRIILECERDQRLAWIYKSFSQPQSKIPFQITNYFPLLAFLIQSITQKPLETLLKLNTLVENSED